jgi:hypothetical protein
MHLLVGLTHNEQEQDELFFFLFFPPIHVSPLLVGLTHMHAARGFEPDIKADGDRGILRMIYAQKVMCNARDRISI